MNISFPRAPSHLCTDPRSKGVVSFIESGGPGIVTPLNPPSSLLPPELYLHPTRNVIL